MIIAIASAAVLSTAAYAQRVSVHTSYAKSSGLPWTAPLYFMLGGPALQTPEAQPIVPLSASVPTP